MLSYEQSLKDMYSGVKERLNRRPAPMVPRIRFVRPVEPVEPVKPTRLVLTACEEIGPASPQPVDGLGYELPHFKIILREVSAQHGVPLIDITSNRRDRATVLARAHAAYRMRHETEMSLPQIGKKLGKRDHSSVFYFLRKWEAEMAGVEFVWKVKRPRPTRDAKGRWMRADA